MLKQSLLAISIKNKHKILKLVIFVCVKIHYFCFILFYRLAEDWSSEAQGETSTWGVSVNSKQTRWTGSTFRFSRTSVSNVTSDIRAW